MVNPFGVEDVSKFAVNRESIKTAADIGRKGRGLKRGTDEADKTLDSVKQAKKDMHKLLRPIASMSQYPGRWGAGAGGTAVAGYGGYKVRKSDDTSAFGVEHISKAKKKDVRKDPAYRESIFYPINPRSETYVRRGADSTLRRVGGPMVGGVVGGATGAALGGGTAASPILGTAGAIGGASLMHTRNVRSGDTVGINRKTGKKAKSKVGFMDASVYNY